MTIQQFGASVKAKYPQYKDVDDVELGKKMLEKYPQYTSKVTNGAEPIKAMTAQEALAKQVPVQGSMEYNPNPVLQGAAKVQEVLGNSEILPMLLAGGARAAVPIPGVSSGVGAAVGKRAQLSLQEGGPMAALKMIMPFLEKDMEKQKSVAKTGLGYGALDLALTGASKLLNPRGTLGNIRQAQVSKSTANVSGDKIIKAVEENAKYVTPNEGESMAKLVDQARKAYSGKQIPLEEAMKIMRKAGDAYTAAGRVGKTVAADFNNAIYGSIRSQVSQLAPNVARTTSALAATYNIPKAIKQVLHYAGLPASVLYGIKKLSGQ